MDKLKDSPGFGWFEDLYFSVPPNPVDFNYIVIETDINNIIVTEGDDPMIVE